MASYRYLIEFYRKDGEKVGGAVATPDLDPLREAAWFDALRTDRIDSTVDAGGLAVAPMWSERLGDPFLRGFRVGHTPGVGDPRGADTTPGAGDAYAPNGPDSITGVFGLEVFAEKAQSTLDDLVERGRLTKGETAYYLVSGYARPDDPSEKPDRPFSTRATSPALPFRNTPLDAFRPRMREAGPVKAEDVPMLLPREIEAEMVELSRLAEGKETGGVLIGHLHRDPGTRDLFIEITAQIPALHTEAASNRLTFTAETWTAVRAALDLRGRSELMLGWWHLHPVREWCKDCPPETRRNCSLSCGYFSSQDRALHRTVFPRAYSVALVVNDATDGPPTFSLFGWRVGSIVERGYHRLETETAAAVPASASATPATAPAATAAPPDEAAATTTPTHAGDDHAQ